MMQIYSPLEEYRKSIKAASPDAGAILQKAANRALSGGLAGAGAMVVQVSTLMWMRTTMNYQYRHGGTTMQALKTIYKDGGGGVKGVLRFYKGFLPALVQGPLSRFGDTAANAGALALLDSYDSTKNLPVGVKTLTASASAAIFRMFLMPVDCLKTTLQVEGKNGIPMLATKIKTNGIGVLWYGAVASASATFVGHYPWFYTNNMLHESLPKPKDFMPWIGNEFVQKLCRNAVRLVASCISRECCTLATFPHTSIIDVCICADLDVGGWLHLLCRLRHRFQLHSRHQGACGDDVLRYTSSALCSCAPHYTERPEMSLRSAFSSADM